MTATHWKIVSYTGMAASFALWALATYTGWINSVAFVSHISMAAIVLAFWSAARADAPTPKEDDS